MTVIVAMILACVTAVFAASASAEEFSLVAENDHLRLYARASDGQLIVEQVETGLRWTSNPDVSTLENYDFLSATWQDTLASPVYFEYFDSRRNVRSANIYSGNPEMAYAEIVDGFEMSYYFPSIEIGFTVQYRLDRDALVATIPWETVSVGDELRLLSIRVLPFLGAQPSSDPDGYMVVPDGSGGLIRFKKQASLHQTGFQEWVYGPDPASAQTTYDPYREPVTLPIFGLHAHGQAFLGIIEGGQETARVVATPAGVITELNWITAEFFYSQPVMMRTSRQGGGIRVFDENPFPGDRSVRFYFLRPEKTAYVEMAERYRSYLMGFQGAERLAHDAKTPPLLVRFFGADFESGSFGRVMQPMTTFTQAAEIVEVLQKSGIDELWVSYMGWNNLGINGNLPKRLPAEKALGGNQGLRELADFLAKRGIPLILEDNYSLARGTRNGFRSTSEASRTAFNDIVRYIRPGQSDGGTTTTYVISPKLMLNYARRDMPQISVLGISGTLLTSLGHTLYSDHNPSGKVQRAQSRNHSRELLQYAGERFSLVGVETGNAYTLGLVDFVTDVSLDTTRDIVIDEAIPFWQIAVHGLVTYYADPVNTVANPERQLLRSLEYGALPSFILTAEPSWKLRYTQSSHLYSTLYTDWLAEIARCYQTINQSLAGVHGQFIVDHRRLADNVYATTYEDGTTVVVNYGRRLYWYAGHFVEPNSFIIVAQEG